jgi:alpha-ketoglutarate-dependent taurine dioxygenase
MDALRAAYEAETVTFDWERGDVLLVDNMLTSHARSSFRGPRRVLVAMADPYERDDL